MIGVVSTRPDGSHLSNPPARRRPTAQPAQARNGTTPPAPPNHSNRQPSHGSDLNVLQINQSAISNRRRGVQPISHRLEARTPLPLFSPYTNRTKTGPDAGGSASDSLRARRPLRTPQSEHDIKRPHRSQSTSQAPFNPTRDHHHNTTRSTKPPSPLKPEMSNA
jgi:hypothetical protein